MSNTHPRAPSHLQSCQINERFYVPKYNQEIKLEVVFFISGYSYSFPPLITPQHLCLDSYFMSLCGPPSSSHLAVGGCTDTLPQPFQKHREKRSTELINSHPSVPARQNLCWLCADHHGPSHSYIIYQHINCFQLMVLLPFLIYNLTD